MAEQVLKITRQANYAVLTLNRPEKRNALNQPLIEALDQALRSSKAITKSARCSCVARARVFAQESICGKSTRPGRP